MEVRLKKEWLGHNSGDIVKVTNDCAKTLFQRDAAEQMEPESNGKIKQRIQSMMAERILESFKKSRKKNGSPLASRLGKNN